VTLALEFSDTVDPATVATVVLAIVAIVGLILTRLALKQTQSEIDLSRREVEEAHRPVVVPIADDRSMKLDPFAPTSAKPTVVGDSELAVPVENIGAGPALRIEASAKLLDAEGKPSLAPTGPQTPATAVGLETGRMQVLRIRTNKWTIGVSFELTLTYEDVAGKAWTTVGRYLDEHKRYEGVNIEPRAARPSE
jgi:hypothetical protein